MDRSCRQCKKQETLRYVCPPVCNFESIWMALGLIFAESLPQVEGQVDLPGSGLAAVEECIVLWSQ